MTEETPAWAFEDEGGFEPMEGGFAATRTPFRAVVSPEETDGEWRFRVVVRVPTLDAVVAGESVADIVEDGWFETLALRLEDGYDVITSTPDADTAVEREGEEVRVEYALATGDLRQGVADAGALVDFVEGTYVQGVIPGYDYTDPVAGLLSAARQAGGLEEDER